MRTKLMLLGATLALLFTSSVAAPQSPPPPTAPTAPPAPATSAPSPAPPPSAPPSPPATPTPPSPTPTTVPAPPTSSTLPSSTPATPSVTAHVSTGSSTVSASGSTSISTTAHSSSSTITSSSTQAVSATITTGSTSSSSSAHSSSNTITTASTITSPKTTLASTAVTSSTGTTVPAPQPTSPPAVGAATPTSVTGSRSTTDILTVPIPPPTVTVSTTQTIEPIPTASVAQLPDTRMVNATESRIQYEGASWSTTKSTCDSELTAMKSQDPSSYLSYRFKVLPGGSVFLGSTRGPDAGVYVVTLDDVQTKLDGYTASTDNNCSFTWSGTNLNAGIHNLTVSFLGPSSLSSSQSGSFELNTFQLVDEDISPSPAGPASGGGRSLHAEISCAALFFAALLHILSS